jgi:tetratricopeptide (TPR) repeat protein
MTQPRQVSGAAATISKVGGAIQLGIEHCRIGSWDLGLSYLTQVSAAYPDKTNLPSLFYSYLGLGVAQRDGRLSEGLRLCEHALKLEFYEVENYLNLARVLLLMGEKKQAVATVERGLTIEPEATGLLILQQQMGKRRRPPIPFLARTNPLNRLLGRVVYALTSS